MDTNESITLANVTKLYTGSTKEKAALVDASVCFVRGEFVAIVGKSGSGKSTLLNMITGIDRPTQGDISFGSTPLQNLAEAKLTSWRGKYIGIVFQFFQLIPTLSVLENIMLPMDFLKIIPDKNRKERAMALLAKTGVSQYANKLPSFLSGGEQQRVAIARSLANDPMFIVADEPTGNLDSQTAQSVLDLFRSVVNDGKTVIMVTHSEDLADCADRKITLSDGRILSDSKAV
ncbi:UNVERIFIED_CONTAM: hypothetical protein B566_EDAN019528 [Ephemera danica]|nr:hypothetical protein B566_EDAN019528 [Ephemera danica]